MRLLFDREALGYGAKVVLSGVTFALIPGERIVVLGRSGTGKSTLLNALYRKLTAEGQRIALVPQEHALVPQLSVRHNVYMGRLDDHGAAYNLLNLAYMLPAERLGIAPVLQLVGLDGLGGQRVETLSGGQKQRTALARAIHRGGAILVGDEPVSSVDERQGADLLEAVAGRFETLVLALHDVHQATRIATRLIGIADGAIRFDRPTAEVRRSEIDDLYRY